MLTRKIIYLLISILFAGCASSYAPREYLSEIEDTQQESFGGWITVISDTAKSKGNIRGIIYAGEFIGYDSLNVYLLADSLIIVPRTNIPKCVLQLDDNDIETFAGWTVLGIISSFTHGYYATVSIPAWLITGILVNSAESARDRYEAKNPDEKYLQSILIYSRFPQGIPSELDLTKLKPKPVE